MKTRVRKPACRLLHELFSLPVTEVKGIRQGRAGRLENLGICSVGDLIYHIPRRYEDRRKQHLITESEPGKPSLFTVQVVSARLRRVRRLSILDVHVEDEAGSTMIVTWFNQPYLLKSLPSGRRMFIYGTIQVKNGRTRCANPELELEKSGEKDDYLHIRRVVPVYPLTSGISQKIMRRLVYAALSGFVGEEPEVGAGTGAGEGAILADPLPEALRVARGYGECVAALWSIHFPEELHDVPPSRERLIYEELFFLQYRMGLEKLKRNRERTEFRCGRGAALRSTVTGNMGFDLTAAQRRSVDAVVKDLAAPHPMCRLLAGEVASGKTCVAALAAAEAVGSGYQVAFMVPTEVLARQQYRSLSKMFTGTDVRGTAVHCEFLVGGQDRARKKACLEGIGSGAVNLVVGTHALIQPKVAFKSLGLVIIDEQHKFGVVQRHKLVSRIPVPHQLVMTATPIPRSLALTLFGDHEFTVLDELPPGRRPVETRVVKPGKLPRVHEHMQREVAAGHRVYVVCPVIDEQEESAARRAVEAEVRELTPLFENLVVLHGRMTSEEREEALVSFRSGPGVLVSTSIIEVGVDDPDVTVVVIRGSEWFGLAQLHQIRGRVGRGTLQSVCYFVVESGKKEAWERVKLLERVTDGLEVARYDLENRGAGEFFGVRQHGVPGTRVSNPFEHLDVLEQARVDAFELLFGAASPGPVASLEKEARARFQQLENILFS